MKNFEKYQDQIAKCIIDCKKTYITICNFCQRKEMCDQLHNLELVKKWFFEEYKEQIKPKEDEKVILRNLLKKHKYLARDEDGTIWLFGQKPHGDIFDSILKRALYHEIMLDIEDQNLANIKIETDPITQNKICIAEIKAIVPKEVEING